MSAMCFCKGASSHVCSLGRWSRGLAALAAILGLAVGEWNGNAQASPVAAHGRGRVMEVGDSPTGQCDPKLNVIRFFVDFSGNVSDAGRTYEGPVCIEVFYNPVQAFAGLQTATTTTAGPDLSKVVLGGAASGGVAVVGIKLADGDNTLLAQIADIEADEAKLKGFLDSVSAMYGNVLQSQNAAIDDIATLRSATSTLSGTEIETGVKNGYATLQPHLKSAIVSKANFSPTDLTDKQGNNYLSLVQKLEDKLARLPLEYPAGALTTFDCSMKSGAVSWGNWIGMCKDSIYTPLKALIDADLQTAMAFTAASDNVMALKKKVATVAYWNFLFAVRGLTTDLDREGIKDAKLGGFYIHEEIRCGALFNQTSSTAINLVTGDLGPTITGDAPTIKSQTAFTTVTCSTPFAVSAGAAFDTIEQKQFAIIQSSDGAGGAVAKFGTTDDSRITPVALAVVHVRLKDYAHHEFGLYGSLGVGGSLQNQSAANPVRFLPGVSVALWRTMYITAGAMIGTATELAGGYKVGDTVPTGITAVDGLTSTSHKVGFGFAFTFTKP